MAWQAQLKGDPLPWLLAQEAPGVRYLALRDLLGVATGDPQLDAARRAAHRAGPIAAILDQMDPAGFWAEPGPGYLPKYRSTVWSVIMLAQLGASIDEDERIGTCVRLRAGSCAGPGRPVLGVRRALRHGRLPAGQPVLGACSSWAAQTPGSPQPSIGWRAASRARGSRRWKSEMRPCATTQANADRRSPADPTTSCRAPGAQSR